MDFQAYIQAYLDDELTKQQQAELSDWLTQDEANREAFVRASMLDTQIHRQLTQSDLHQFLDQVDVHSLQSALEQSSSDSGTFAAQMEMDADPDWMTPKPAEQVTLKRAVGVLAHEGAQLAGKSLRKHAVPLALAAAVVLAITLFVVFQGGEDRTPELVDRPDDRPAVQIQTVATLTDQHNAQWAERALARGSELHPGQTFTLTAGFAEITTARGAVAILEAPATIELTDNNNAVYLHTGKLVGICHTESSKGFVVKADHADIIDLGTEFGVQVTRNKVTTTVFTGEVVVNTPGGEPEHLTTNQTARVTVNGSNREMVIEYALAEGFAKRLPRRALVTAARINLPGYQADIMPQGVWEDVVRVTDDVHELNGLDASGLPIELLGGDLVRMPIAARMDANASSLTLELDFAQPADVYLVLLDDEPEHDWLMRDYERTMMRVGLDQGKKNRSGFTAVGPGESIDYTANVWKRKRPATGTTAVAWDTERSTYSIIVQPANQDRPN